MARRRLLNVANRLPVTVRVHSGKVECGPSSGGLVAGLRGYHEPGRDLWFGWSGASARLVASHGGEIDRQLAALGLVGVPLSDRQVTRYYEELSNGLIWPLFHYSVDRIPAEGRGWDTYREVNERFADAVASRYQDGDLVWVHDYHLMLVPSLLRRRVPNARIGFFLHIPFPAFEVFRVLPWRRQVLEGLCGADLVGFHTFSYLKHFEEAVKHELGLESNDDCIALDDRRVRIGTFPMGPDVERFSELTSDPAVLAEAASIRKNSGGRTIMLGVDRLDYTKGIPRRLLAFERLLQVNPSLRDSVRLIQVTVPSRDSVEPYRVHRSQVEEAVGRINGSVGTIASAPIHYLHRSLSEKRLAALYVAARVMLVTPLRDGMNLVAKEFVTCRSHEDGVLVLSEFAGASEELQEAVLVNPYDVDGLADAMRRALEMDQSECQARMRSLRRHVLEGGVQEWATHFLVALEESPCQAARTRKIPVRNDSAKILAKVKPARTLVAVLDYDGTLVPLVEHPGKAVPDQALLDLLARLASSPGCAVHIVSGRPPTTLEQWFEGLPVTLWGEHGLWYREKPGALWFPQLEIPEGWVSHARPILDEYTELTPGSFVEEKTASLAWHYRMADEQVGPKHAAQLLTRLRQALKGSPADVLEGHRVLEIRPGGVNKGLPVQHIVSKAAGRTVVMAIGDDRTDEDMFRALPITGVSVRVGATPSAARYHVPAPSVVRTLLEDLCQQRHAGRVDRNKPVNRATSRRAV